MTGIKAFFGIIVLTVAIIYFRQVLETPKKEFSILQLVISSSKIFTEIPEIIEERDGYLVMLIKGNYEKKIAILLNPNSTPYYKQIPSDLNYTLSLNQLNSIRDKFRINETVDGCLQSHLGK